MKSQMKSLFIFTATIAALSSCGTSGVTELDAQPNPQTNNDNPTPTPSFPPGNAPYDFDFNTCGRSPKKFTEMIKTDNLLNVMIKAGEAPSNDCYNPPRQVPYNARYSCARFRVRMYIKVGINKDIPYEDPAAGDYWQLRWTSSDAESPRLKAPNTNGCDGAVDSKMYNLSNYLYAGHGLVKFEVESLETNHLCNQYKSCKQQNPNYWSMSAECRGYFDFPYFNYGNYWGVPKAETSFCPMKAVYQYHSVNGHMAVQIDDSIL